MRRMAFLTSLAMLVLASLGAVTASAEEIDVRAARLRATEEVKDTDKVSELVLAKHTKGEKADQGYRYLKEAGLSVQGQDANNAWKTAANIIKALGVKAEVTFVWYDNPKAVKPGETGKFVLG